MQLFRPLFAALFLATAPPALAADPVVVDSAEQSKLIREFPDGGLPMLAGVRNIQVFRSSRDALDITDGKGWTYNHHMDLACWKGKLYVAWTNGEKDEDTWPAREVYSTSDDGLTWSAPKELFPQGVSTSLRVYFFHAPNGKMLVMAGERWSQELLKEELKRGAVVREIRADHSLGDVFTLIADPRVASAPPFFSTSADKEFAQACGQLLANRAFLETQDYGELLGERKMKWHDIAANNRRIRNFGKAFSFFHRKDGALVGIGKQGWTIVSTDEGESWAQPLDPPSLVTGNAKVWGQRTSDGRYALVYNPAPTDRFPLVMVTGDDGINFANMRVVHGEVPPERYEGLHKNLGPQYTRGISEWTSDGSRKDDAMWIVYSSNKEDIWVSRIPIPAKTSGWSTYSPRWAPVTVNDGVQLEDRDPFDYARAQYVFPAAKKLSADFTVQADQLGRLEIELFSTFGGLRPIRIAIDGGKITTGTENLGTYANGKPIKFHVDADAATAKFTIAVNGTAKEFPLAEPGTHFQRISFRTGENRAVGKVEPVAVGTDKPGQATKFTIREIAVR